MIAFCDLLFYTVESTSLNGHSINSCTGQIKRTQIIKKDLKEYKTTELADRELPI